MAEWAPDEQMVIDAPDKPVGRDKKSKVFFYVIPANAAGKWRWEMPVADKPAVFNLNVAQNFQSVTGSVEINGATIPLEKARLRGEDISFLLNDVRSKTRYEFTGKISGRNIAGTAQVASANAQRRLEWDAVRTESGTPAHALLKKPTMQELQKKLQ